MIFIIIFAVLVYYFVITNPLLVILAILGLGEATIAQLVNLKNF